MTNSPSCSSILGPSAVLGCCHSALSAGGCVTLDLRWDMVTVGSRVGARTVSSEAKAHRKRGFHSVTCLSHGACLSCWEEALARGAAVCHVWPTAVAKGPRDGPRPRNVSGSHPGASRFTPSGRGPRLHPVYPLSLGSWEAAPWGLGC